MCNSLCMWENTKTQVRHLFTRQAVSMLWDFAEANVFAEAAGDYIVSLKNLCKALKGTCTVGGGGHASQLDARMLSKKASFSTDPPYYDNIGYSDLSDFFYVWLRRILAPIYPDIFRPCLYRRSKSLALLLNASTGTGTRRSDILRAGLRPCSQQFGNTRLRTFRPPSTTPSNRLKSEAKANPLKLRPQDGKRCLRD